jgi:gliding motility-associated-like protein
MKKNLILPFLFSFCSYFAIAQSCDNVGFEDGNKSNWTCKMGTYGTVGNYDCNAEQVFPLVMNQNSCSTSPNDGGLQTTKLENRHTLMTNKTAMDPNTNNANPISCVAPVSMFPSGVNNYSFRIGNGLGGGTSNLLTGGEALAESMSYTFTVTAQNAGLTYMYAAFLLETNNLSGLHKGFEAPRFEIKITHKVNGKDELIDCGHYNVDVGTGNQNNFLDGKTVTIGNVGGVWKYTRWTKVGLDLTAYLGQSVTIEFTTADCFPKDPNTSINGKCPFEAGGHSAYAYIDLYCTPIQIASPPICANSPSVELCGPDGYTNYQWESGPGITTGLNQKCITIKNPKAGDTYTVNMKSLAGNCPNKTTIVLKGSDFTIADVATCPGKSIKLTPITTTGQLSDYDWKWEPQQNLDNYNIAEPTFTPGANTTYTVTMIDRDVKNCNQVKIITVNVGAGFTVKTAGATICEGDEATITATGAETYTWEPGTLTGATIKVKPTTTTTYTVTGKMSNSPCAGDATSTAIVTVNKKPIITTTAQTICVGESAKLSATVTGGSNGGKWVGGEGVFTPGRSTLNASYKPSVTEETAGTVVLTLESDAPKAPCVKDSKTLTITIVPPVTSDAGPDQTICIGESVTLNGVFGGAATSGSWSGGTGTYTPSNADPKAVYKPSAAEETAGNVTLKFTVTNASNNTCPGGMDEMKITIDPMPSVSAGADQTICFGETAKLVGTMNNATVGTWSGGNGTFTPNNTTLTATYTPTAAEMAAGTVTLTLTTNAPGKCPAKSSSMTIRINPVAVVDAGPTQRICANGSATLAGVPSGSATSGIWSGGTGNYAPNNSVSNPTYTPSAAEQTAGKVVLTFTTNDPVGPCPAVYDTMTIFIDQLPVATILSINSICAGDDIKLNGSVTGAATSGTWSGGTGKYTKNNTDLTGTYTPTDADKANGNVKFYLTTNKTGLCPIDVDSVIIPIYPNPVINFTVDTPKACPDHCVKFTDASTVVGGNITKWEWSFGNDTAKSKNPNTCFPIPGFYDITLKATSDKGCSTTLTKPQFIQTYDKPKANFIANPWAVSQYDPTIHFYDRSSTDVVTWKWELGDGKIITPKTQNPIHKYEVGIAHTYMVKLYVVNANGCVDSIQKPVDVLPEFTFYIPNAFTPNRVDGTNDTFFGKGVGIVSYHIWIFDRWGNMVFHSPDIDAGWDGRANGGELPAQQDVFVWKVKLTDVFGKKHDYIGTVTLVR